MSARILDMYAASDSDFSDDDLSFHKTRKGGSVASDGWESLDENLFDREQGNAEMDFFPDTKAYNKAGLTLDEAYEDIGDDAAFVADTNPRNFIEYIKEDDELSLDEDDAFQPLHMPMVKWRKGMTFISGHEKLENYLGNDLKDRTRLDDMAVAGGRPPDDFYDDNDDGGGDERGGRAERGGGDEGSNGGGESREPRAAARRGASAELVREGLAAGRMTRAERIRGHTTPAEKPASNLKPEIAESIRKAEINARVLAAAAKAAAPKTAKQLEKAAIKAEQKAAKFERAAEKIERKAGLRTPAAKMLTRAGYKEIAAPERVRGEGRVAEALHYAADRAAAPNQRSAAVGPRGLVLDRSAHRQDAARTAAVSAAIQGAAQPAAPPPPPPPVPQLILTGGARKSLSFGGNKITASTPLPMLMSAQTAAEKLADDVPNKQLLVDKIKRAIREHTTAAGARIPKAPRGRAAAAARAGGGGYSADSDE